MVHLGVSHISVDHRPILNQPLFVCRYIFLVGLQYTRYIELLEFANKLTWILPVPKGERAHIFVARDNKFLFLSRSAMFSKIPIMPGNCVCYTQNIINRLLVKDHCIQIILDAKMFIFCKQYEFNQ